MNLYPQSTFDFFNKLKIHFSNSIDTACEQIHRACEGTGTDEKTLVKVLGPCSPNDRSLIAYRYEQLYKTPLRDHVKSETSGDFGYLLQLICMSVPHAEAYVLYHAMKGVGTSENLIYPIVLGRTNKEINVLKKAFAELYGTDLSAMANDEVSGDFRQIVTTALQETQEDHTHIPLVTSKAEEDAETIYRAGEGERGTHEGAIIKTLLASSPSHLKRIEEVYMERHNRGLARVIENEFSGSSAQALAFHVNVSLDPWNTLADLIHNAMDGIGTNESALSAALVRYHPYMTKIQEAYELKNKTSLRDRVRGDTSGSYQELVLHVMDAPRSVSEVV
jgi:hypothetical protein